MKSFTLTLLPHLKRDSKTSAIVRRRILIFRKNAAWIIFAAMSTDEFYMQRCLQLARLGECDTAPNPMVGAILVHEDRIIGEGYHQQYGLPHAEVNCINSVKKEDESLIEKSTLYVSLEPCAHFGKTPPCADLIIRNKIPKVVVGCRDPFDAVNGKGIEKLKNANIDVKMSEAERACILLNRRFFTFHKRKRPYIVLKWAQTADGSIAHWNPEMENRLYISNDMVSRLVHQWRSNEAAILIGTRTAILDNPRLTNRLWKGKSPIRLVIDKKRSINLSNPLFDGSTPTIVFSNIKGENSRNLQYVTLSANSNWADEISDYCYANNIQSILAEGGQRLLQSFIDKDLWDEARIITNENMFINNGLKAPSFKQTVHIDNSYKLENNRVDSIYHPHLNEL